MNPSKIPPLEDYLFYNRGGNRFHINELFGETGTILVVLLFTPCERGFHIICMSALTWAISDAKTLDTRIEWSGYVIRIHPSTVR